MLRLSPATLARRFARSRRPIVHTVIAALIASTVTILAAPPAAASHFRFRDLTWRFDHASEQGNVVELTLRFADRLSFHGHLHPGDTFTDTVDTGDGDYAVLEGEVVAVNEVDDWFIAEVRGFHTYPLAGPYIVSWESCCTLSTLRNSPDSYLRTTTVVNLDGANRASPTSLVSPIVNVPADGGLQSFRVSATDPDGDNVSFRLATEAESYVTQPPGLQINDRTGVVTWDTTGLPTGLWLTTVVMSDPTGASTMNSFLVNLGGNASAAPSWVAPTPADRTNVSAKPGDTLPLVLAANDPDGEPVTITPLNAPPGLSCTDETSLVEGNYELYCAWRPQATGTHLIAFDAQDPSGASAGMRVYRLTAPRYVAFGDSYSSGEGALDAANYEDGTNHDAGGNGCRRASTAYPGLLAADPDSPWTLNFVACSGARTWHFYDAQHPDGPGKVQEPQLERARLGQDVELVTLTIGGNDAKFSEIIKECILGFELLPLNDCSSDAHKSEDVVQDAFARLRGEQPKHGEGYAETRPLADIYADILRQAPRARVIVLGYPQFFRDGGTFLTRCSQVHRSDQQWVNEKVAEMNAMLKEQAESLGLEFLPTSDAFEGHRLCEIGGGEDREWFRDITFDEIGGPDNASFHPDDDGHFAEYQLLLNKIANPPATVTMTTGEIRDYYVTITDGLQEWLDVFTRWPGSDVEMTVTSPSGVVYDRANVNNAKHLLGPTFESFRIPDPEQGRWHVQLYGADLGADGEPVQFNANTRAAWNYPPEARFTHTLDGKTLALDAAGSTDPDGDALTGYRWFIRDEFGTIAELAGKTASYTFEQNGDFAIGLRVDDERGKAGFTGSREPVHVGGKYTVAGPQAPLEPSADWSLVTAGRTLPVKWHLSKDGAPVSNPASFAGLSSRAADCDTASQLADPVAGDTAGASGLSYSSDGNWKFNWQTKKDWSGSCRLMTVSFDDGTTMKTQLRFR